MSIDLIPTLPKAQQKDVMEAEVQKEQFLGPTNHLI